MKTNSIDLLITADEIHEYVLNLWSDGPIQRSHRSGGLVHEIVERFATIPRFFYHASDTEIEWTHFSAWWSGIMQCDYDRPLIRDLRYLHEMYHAGSLPHLRNCSLDMLAAKNFTNERQASTFTEMAIYLELPELRPMTFDHTIFVDRFLFPNGDLTQPDPQLIKFWKSDRQVTFDFLLEQRRKVIEAAPGEINLDDPQVIWLRRYGQQGQNWMNIWSDRFVLVENAMVDLKEAAQTNDALARRVAAQTHLDWLLSEPISEGTDVPFVREARAFRAAFDALVNAYDTAMASQGQNPVKGTARGDQAKYNSQ